MNWFQRLLGLDFPAGADLTSLRFALRGGLPGWLVALLVTLVIAFAVLVYSRESVGPFRSRRWWLAGVRAALLAMLVALVARPAVVAEAEGVRNRPVVILVDDSASLKLADRRLSSADLLRVAIATGNAPADANPEGPEWQSAAKEELAQTPRLELVRSAFKSTRMDLGNKLAQKFATSAYLFGAKPRRVAVGGIDKALTAEEQRTALWDVLREIAATPEGDVPGAIVLVTDGLDNASQATLEETIAELKKADVAVHVYGVGSTDSGAVRLIDAAVPETLFLDDMANVPVRYMYRGTGTPMAVVTAMLAGKEVAKTEVKLEQGEGRTTLSFVPERRTGATPEGELIVSIRLKNDPGATDDVRKPVRVSERRVRVLVVDDAPRWEFKFLQPALSRDRRVDATYFVLQGDPRALRGVPFVPTFPTRDKLFSYDLVILGDVPPSALGPDGVATLTDYVRDGGGLVVIAGRKAMPADYADTPLAEVLPVEFVPVRFPPAGDERTSAVVPELTAAGRRSQMTNLAASPEENEQLWRELPGFYWHYPVTRLRPGATALATIGRRAGDDTAEPVMAAQYYGKGPVLFIGGEETWRWRYNQGDRLFARFWGQVAYQLGLPHLLGQASRVQLALDRSEAVVGRPGYVYARLYDSDYRPFVADTVPATLEHVDAPGGEKAKNVSLTPVPGRVGEYRVLLPNDVAGRYELKLQQPETGSLPFRVVLPPGHELEPLGLNEPALKSLAKETGGAFYREEDLARLPSRVQQRTAPFTARQEAILWGPMALVLFLSLVTAEWIGRKFANLS
ncbi:MAG: hypothetical protein K1X57_03260 [Gemmataceae bacterium]|nr:hypothetical protein [Gemmataceae bacterium]